MQSSKCMCMHSFMSSSTYLSDSKLLCAFKASIFHQQQIDRNGAEFSEICSFTQFSPSLHEFLCHFTKHSNAHTKQSFHEISLTTFTQSQIDITRFYFYLFLFIFNLQFKFFIFSPRAWFFFLSLSSAIKRSQIKLSTSLNIFSTPFNFHWQLFSTCIQMWKLIFLALMRWQK